MRRLNKHAYDHPQKYWGAVMVNEFDEQYTPCAYCGDPYSEIEHVLPVSLSDRFTHEEMETWMRKLLFTVPACSECNSIAGPVVDQTFGKRRKRVKQRLHTKYARYVDVPEWTAKELKTLGSGLQAFVRAGMERQEALLARLRY